MTRLYFTTDVHGSETCFRKFLNAWKFYKADVLILGGDITGKLLVPVIAQANGTYSGSLLGHDYELNTEEEIAEFEHRSAMAGFYAYQTTPEEVAALQKDRAMLDKLFARLIYERVERWLALADERLERTGIRCFVTPGNDDQFNIDPLFESAKYVTNPEGKVTHLDDTYEMISTGWSTFTPWNSPREISEEDMAAKISVMISQVQRIQTCVFNFHDPPFDTKIDRAPKLDENLKPVLKGGGVETVPVGSVAVREAIEEYQPLLSLHGHVHESRGVHRLGATLAINPGSSYGDGTLQGVVVDLPEPGRRGKLRYQLVAG
jgi:Icc-related predicted phosphoesterase